MLRASESESDSDSRFDILGVNQIRYSYVDRINAEDPAHADERKRGGGPDDMQDPMTHTASQ